jgi:hypothetical protein
VGLSSNGYGLRGTKESRKPGLRLSPYILDWWQGLTKLREYYYRPSIKEARCEVR